MYQISEQQALELTQKCNSIKDVTNPAVFSQIEAIVLRAVLVRQLPDDEVKHLYELLLCAVVVDHNKQEANNDEVRDEWMEHESIDRTENDERTKLRDVRNHLLLSSRTNLRTIEAMRHCIQLIAVPEIHNVVCQENRR